MKPNILYISDDYAKNVRGTKISIFKEMKNRGYNIIWQDRKFLINSNKDITYKKFKELISNRDINQVWLSHSSLVLPTHLKKYCENRNLIVVGFGFSDPNYFDHKKRFPSYDIYITNSILIYNKYKVIIPCIYNPTACDFNFHGFERKYKNIYASIIGRGKHPFMENKDASYRIKTAEYLIKNGINLKIYGKDWHPLQSNNPIIGKDFLNIIHNSDIGIDLQSINSPLAHRMFEYSACGTLVITKKRDEVFLHFEDDKEILSYINVEDLLEKLKWFNSRRYLLKDIGKKAYERCLTDHNISNRIDHVTKELNDILGDIVF